MLKNRIITCLLICCAMLFLLGSCKPEPTPEPDPPVNPWERPMLKSHTLIFYFMGSGSGLETFMDAGISKVLNAAADVVSENTHIAIFYDRGNYTRLTEVVYEDDRIKQKMIKEYNSVTTQSTDPKFMSEVIELIKTEMPAESYGLVFSSHGGGWVPSEIFDSYMMSMPAQERERRRTAPLTKFFGQDDDDYMEIPELAEALGNHEFDYILFDACFMSSIEALYDLRHAADYIVASPAEVLGAGFPYETVIPLLFRETHCLEAVAGCFVDFFRNESATVAVVQTDKLEALAQSMRQILVTAGDKTVDVSDIQGYEGFAPHLYFDLEHYVETLASGKELENFRRTLDEMVIFTDHTDKFYSDYGPDKGYIPLSRSCGVSCHVKTAEYPDTHAAYLNTEWAKTIGAK